MPFGDARDLKFYLSGGAGNTDIHQSLGGTISTTELLAAQTGGFSLDQTVQTIVGFTFISARGNDIGIAVNYLHYDISTNVVSFNGGEGIEISSDGQYTFYSDDYATITVDIVLANFTETVQIICYFSQAGNNIFNNVLGVDSRANTNKYRCLYLKNEGVISFNVTMELATSMSSSNISMYTGFTPLGANIEVPLLVDESIEFATPPTWIPKNSSHSIIIPSGSYYALLLRRAVIQGIFEDFPDNFFQIKYTSVVA